METNTERPRMPKGQPIKIDKSYTIKFGCGGVRQYVTFRESQGQLVYPRFSPSWVKTSEVPDVTNMKTIDEVMTALKDCKVIGNPQIYLINGHPVFYTKKKRTQKLVNKLGSAVELFIQSQVAEFFDKELKPLLIKNKWKISTGAMCGYYILVGKDESGNWDNVSKIDSKKEFEFEYICSECLSALNLCESPKLCKEYGDANVWESHKLFMEISDKIMASEFYIENI